MKCPSVKAWTSVVEIIIAVLCLLAIFLLSCVVNFPDDMNMFLYQCSLATTTVICLIFAFSTWFNNSNHPKTRFHVRIFIVVVLWTMFVFGLVTAILFDKEYFGKYIYGYFERDIFDEMDFVILYIAMLLGIIALVLLFVVNIILTVDVCRKARKNSE